MGEEEDVDVDVEEEVVDEGEGNANGGIGAPLVFSVCSGKRMEKDKIAY